MISRGVLRATIAVLVGADLLFLFFAIGAARAAALANGVAISALDDLLSGAIVSGAIVAVGIVAALGFGRRPGRLWEGLLALGTLMVLSTVHGHLFGTPWRHLFYSGLCLAGWLLGLAVSRHRGAPSDESYAYTGSLALLGAAYLSAGISKLVFGGLDWVSAVPIQAAVIGQDGLVGDTILSRYRAWVVTTPLVASFFSVATLGFELAGPLMLVGRRTRLVVALGLLAMHANIYLLTPILYWESMVLVLMFGLSADVSSPETAVDRAMPILGQRRAFVAVAALLAVGAALAIDHQRRRWAQLHTLPASMPAPAPVAAAPAPIPTPPTLRQVGPFGVGQTLAGDWAIDALSLSDGGFVASLSGSPGRAAFEVTCAPSKHRSPFDIGAAHIFYSSDLDYRDLETVGFAVQARVRQAAGGDDVCDAVVSWRTEAHAAQPR